MRGVKVQLPEGMTYKQYYEKFVRKTKRVRRKNPEERCICGLKLESKYSTAHGRKKYHDECWRIYGPRLMRLFYRRCAQKRLGIPQEKICIENLLRITKRGVTPSGVPREKIKRNEPNKY